MYGIVQNKIPMILPNVIGLALCLIQIVLVILYPHAPLPAATKEESPKDTEIVTVNINIKS